MIGNTGSFMSNVAGGQNGAGPALQRLLAMRNQGASPSPLNGNTQNPSAVPPAAPSQVSAIPAPVPSLAPQGAPSPIGQAQQPQPQGGQNPELSMALGALASFIASHGKALEARHGVNLEKARAKAMTPPQMQGGE